MSYVLDNLKIDATIPKELNSGSKSTGPKFLLPGRHTVKITAVKEPQESLIDPTWLNIGLTVENEGGKSGFADLLIPTSKLTFGKYNSVRELKNLRNFLMAAFGETEVNSASLNRTVTKGAKLIGKKIEVEVGYTRAHVEKQKDGTFILKDSKKQYGSTFSSYDDAYAFAEQTGVKYQKFPKVIAFVEPSKVEDSEQPF